MGGSRKQQHQSGGHRRLGLYASGGLLWGQWKQPCSRACPCLAPEPQSCARPAGASAESWAVSPCDGACFNVLCPSLGPFFSPGGQPAPPGPPASRAKSQSLDPFADLGDLSSSLQGEVQGVSGCAVLGPPPTPSARFSAQMGLPLRPQGPGHSDPRSSRLPCGRGLGTKLPQVLGLHVGAPVSCLPVARASQS